MDELLEHEMNKKNGPALAESHIPTISDGLL